MPYIKIKCYPKDEETKRKVADRIDETFLELWGCSAQAISVSFEEVNPEDWQEVVKNEIEPASDNMMIMEGKKKY